MLQEQSSWRGGAAARALTIRDGSFIAINAKRAYEISGVRTALVDAEPSASWERDVVVEADEHAAFRRGTDVVVRGSCFAAQPASYLDTRVQVGPLSARVRVWGKRIFERSAGGCRVSEAEPFVERELSWSAAYGGVAPTYARPAAHSEWRAAEAAEPVDLDLRNPDGRGYLGRSGIVPAEGSEAPSQEDPSAPLTMSALLRAESWLSAPWPAGLGPLTIVMYPRVAGWLPAVPQPSGAADPYRCAAAGLGGVQLDGREPIELENLNPGQRVQRTSLPAEAPVAEIRLPGCATRTLPLALKTVFIEPGSSRMFLTWSAALRTLVPFDDTTLAEAPLDLTWRKL